MREGIDREDAAHAEGGWLTWLADCGVPALTGVDTRALVRHIRDQGAMRGGVFARRRCPSPRRASGSMAEPPDERPRPGARGHAAPSRWSSTRRRRAARGGASTRASRARSCATCASAACALELHPCTTRRRRAARPRARRRLPGQRPGRPGRARLRGRDACASSWARCPCGASASATSCSAARSGLETFKLPFGHRGANHPVKDLETGRIEITSQNHGFAVLGPGGERTIDGDEPVRWETDFGAAELSQLNLYDRTVEGLVLRDVPGSTVQYHPEAGPGPARRASPLRPLPGAPATPA